MSWALDEAGVARRGTGSTTADGRRSRARQSEARAAERLGVEDLVGWLRERRAQGWTMQQLSAAVGHCGPWVRWRLRDAAETG